MTRCPPGIPRIKSGVSPGYGAMYAVLTMVKNSAA
jgi:hypothetical protein